MLVALNKLDLPEAQERLSTLKATLKRDGYRVFEISAATGQGVQELMRATAEILREAETAAEPVQKPQQRRVYTLEGVDERLWTVEKTGDGRFLVTGIGIERLTRMTNFELEDAVTRFQNVLQRSGIEAELERLGVEDGDTVTIAGYDLIWGEQELEEPQLGSRRKRGIETE
jgi:GTP-binding protein